MPALAGYKRPSCRRLTIRLSLRDPLPCGAESFLWHGSSPFKELAESFFLAFLRPIMVGSLTLSDVSDAAIGHFC